MGCARHHGPRGYVEARLHRRLFIGFGASIIGTGFLLALLTAMFSDWSPRVWHQEQTAFRNFAAERFVDVWGDPVRRAELAVRVASELGVQVEVRDRSGVVVAQAGPACDVAPVFVPIGQPDEPSIGTLGLCASRYRYSFGTKLAVLLGVSGLLLWGAAGRIARRLTAPLGDLVRVTQEIGLGNLASRAPTSCQTPDEVGVLADAINEMADRIERQLADQRVLLAGVSHELRTPLGHLRLLVELARRGGSDPKALDEIEAELVEIDQLVGELLASSRLDFTALSPQSLDARDVAARALDRAGLDHKKLVVEGNPGVFRADPTLVQRALANLIDNAEKHGGGVAKLVVREQQGRVIFAVEDQGAGIRPGEEVKIFEPFYRPEQGSGSQSTLGLGLALVRRIAEAHGGRAYAENKIEGGARVSLELTA